MTGKTAARLAVAAFLLGAALLGWLLWRSLLPSGPSPALPGAPGEGVQAADLYFADRDGQRLAIERREIAPGLPEELARQVALELIRGPRGDLTATLPGGTELLGIWLREGTAYLSFSAALSSGHPGGGWTETLSVYSIVNSVAANVPGVHDVQILIEGREVETLAGHVVLDRPLSPRPNLVSGSW